MGKDVVELLIAKGRADGRINQHLLDCLHISSERKLRQLAIQHVDHTLTCVVCIVGLYQRRNLHGEQAGHASCLRRKLGFGCRVGER